MRALILMACLVALLASVLVPTARAIDAKRASVASAIASHRAALDAAGEVR